jgi:hypothetical protein
MTDTPSGDAVSAWLRALGQQLIAAAVAEAMANQSAATDVAMQRLAQGMADMTAEMRAIRQQLSAASSLPAPAPAPEEPKAPITPPSDQVPVPLPAAKGNRVEMISADGKVWPLDLGEISPGEPRRVEAEVPAEIAGCTSMRLVVDVGEATNGARWADVAPRNDIAMRDGGGDAAPYSVRVVLDGEERQRWDVPQHAHYTGWLRQVSTAPLPDPVWPSDDVLKAAGVLN